MQLAHQVLNLAMIVCSVRARQFRPVVRSPANATLARCPTLQALMIWKGLMVVTESESPVVVVLR